MHRTTEVGVCSFLIQVLGRQEQKGMTEDELVGWHHYLNGHEFKQAQGDGGGQGNLACCNPWGQKETDTTK